MISNICYALVFLAESLISFYYFDLKFERKISKSATVCLLMVSFSLLYLLNFLEIPIINLLGFFICNFLFARICYRSRLKSILFNTSVLVFLMLATELIVFYFTTLLFEVALFESYNDELTLIIQSLICKLLYFLSIHFVLKFSKKESSKKGSNFSLILCVLPVTSIIMMHTTAYVCIIYSVKESFRIALVIGNILLLISNILVFYINELTVQLNHKYTEILLDKQQEKNTIEYYQLLKEQNENSKVLIHDITKHFNTIKQLSEDRNSNIAQYISNIIDDFSIMNPIDYCNNSVVNLITHRYYEICKKHDINFTININNAKVDFIKDHDITALLDNLLENAVEATMQTDDKFIDFSIVTRNSNFVIIKVSNSCAKRPNYINGVLITSKSSTDIHGIGTRSIKRIVSKYNGNLETDYDNESKTFTSIIGINTNPTSI